MAIVLAATHSGCKVFSDAGETHLELAGREVCALAPQASGACLAVVDAQQIWHRDPNGVWSQRASTDLSLQSIASVGETVFAGAMDQAAVVRISAGGEGEWRAQRLKGFDTVPGRGDWFAGGPPLGVRSLIATVDGAAILAAVHVGGIPRSSDNGETWTPTLPIAFDVHEVCAHPSLPNIVAAAAAVGLCVSDDSGRNWKAFSEGFERMSSLAAAALHDEVLFSIQDGPFAKSSQIRRWQIGDYRVEQVRDGLPEWLDGRVDTAHIAAGGGRAAVADDGGNLWLSTNGSRGWRQIAANLPYVFALSII